MKPDVRGFFDPVTATWSYVVYADGHADKRCAVIDTVLDYDIHSGRTKTESADRVIDFIKKKGLEVQWVLETHIHADHLTGSAYVKEKLGGKSAISKHILKVLETWEPIFHNEADTPLMGYQFDHTFADDEVFTVGPFEAHIIHTPGHTPADTTYIIGDAVFVGDSMFLPDVGTGRCDFPGGSADDSYNSSRKLLSLPEGYRMYVGHDYPPNGLRAPQCMATIGEQKRANVRVGDGITKEQYVTKRNKDDHGKEVPKLLLPSIQVNLRGGTFGQATDGVQYVKLPVDKI
ncbi:MAG: MBL fold metallo-hydrolase [Alphaproteobacteria bacterium RIFCSPHIGHO2_02_FULL_46_13]|nr:MAG: MBL fold metallo-hydrolase [Alphaproteobacteria bacterium RIFCSPHIGHO2_02_FULL_46_13]